MLISSTSDVDFNSYYFDEFSKSSQADALCKDYLEAIDNEGDTLLNLSLHQGGDSLCDNAEHICINFTKKKEDLQFTYAVFKLQLSIYDKKNSFDLSNLNCGKDLDLIHKKAKELICKTSNAILFLSGYLSGESILNEYNIPKEIIQLIIMSNIDFDLLKFDIFMKATINESNE